MAGKMPHEKCLRAWDKKNRRMSTTKPTFEGLIGERTMSFILSFPGEQNSDQWVEVTWGYNSKNFLTRQLSSSGAGCPVKEGRSPRAWHFRAEVGRLARTSPRSFTTLQVYLRRGPWWLQQSSLELATHFINRFLQCVIKLGIAGEYRGKTSYLPQY